MYEFHGWITIVDTVDENEESEETLSKVVADISSYANSLVWLSGLMDIRVVNGRFFLATNGYRNHKDSVVDSLFGLFDYVARVAPASYGLLCIHDDDVLQLDMQAKTYELANGQISETMRPFRIPST